MLVEAPIFHLAPPSGWVNDPNGPLFYNNRYHLFYQHLGASRSWAWGLSWGHVSSSDLVHWRHHQPALNPGTNSYDSDGCFSGCAAVLPAAEAAAAAAAAGLLGGTSNITVPAQAVAAAELQGPRGPQQICSINHTGSSSSSRDAEVLPNTGVPVLLYTGVVLKPDRPEGLKPNSLTVSELCTERQLAAVAADPSDSFLEQWRKLPGAWLEHPPPGMCLNCFRDPFVLERPCPANQHTWRLMIGAGIRQPDTGLPCAGDTGTAATTTAAAGQSVMSSSSSSRKMSGATTTTPAAAVGHSSAGINSSSCSGDGSSSFDLREAMATKGLDAHAAAPAAAAAAAAGVTACADPRRAANGTALVYKSKQLLSGWQFEGLLCTAHQADLHGAVWECPVLAQLPRRSNSVNPGISTSTNFGFTEESSPLAERTAPATAHRHFFCVSTGASPAVYWLGQYADGKFDLESAVGPLPLDLGDLLYAPNLLTATQDDASGRVLMWGWLSELPHPHCSSAGCISLPRQLSLSAEGHLLQQPLLPELTALHTGPAWSVEKLLLEPQVPRHIGLTIPSSYFHLQLTLTPNPTAAVATAGQFAGSSSTHSLAGIVLPAWASQGPGCGSRSSSSDDPHNQNHEAVGQGAVLLYDFATCQLCLTVGPSVGSELLPLSGSTMPVELPPVDAPPNLLPGCQSQAVAAVPQSSFGTSASAVLGTPSSQDGCQSEHGGGFASAVLEKYMPAGGGSDNSWKSNSRSGSARTVGLPNGLRQLGGHLRLQPFQPLQLQLFMDYSLLEVFSGDGQVLATRVYRGVWPCNSSTDGTSSSTAIVQDAAERGGLVDDSSVTVAAEGSCNPTNSSSQHRAATGEAGEGLEALSLVGNLSDVACGLQPQGPGGVYLLSVGYSAVAENVSMYAMGSAWIDGGSGT